MTRRDNKTGSRDVRPGHVNKRRSGMSQDYNTFISVFLPILCKDCCFSHKASELFNEHVANGH